MQMSLKLVIFYILFQTNIDALQVMYTPERGRFVVASRDIDVAECIMHEEAIVNIVNFRYSLTHCYNCQMDTSINPTPCRKCSAVVFCSDQCKRNAEST